MRKLRLRLEHVNDFAHGQVAENGRAGILPQTWLPLKTDHLTTWLKLYQTRAQEREHGQLRKAQDGMQMLV